MRWSVASIAVLALASAAWATEVKHEGTFVAWGGEGQQVFRHKVAVCRNNVYSERSTLVLVDDLPRRGARIGIQRFTVEYTGGEQSSQRILDAIHKKPYEYILVPVYQVPQSPRMARVVLPQARGVKATFRFYRNRRRLKSGEIDSGLIQELTRTVDTQMLEQLPAIHPMREPSIRLPRRDPNAAVPSPAALAAIEPPVPPVDAPLSDAGAPVVSPVVSSVTATDLPVAGGISENDPRIELARRWSQQIAEELKGQTAPPPPPSDDPPGYLPPPMGVGVSNAPSDAPAERNVEYMEDTPEMKAAQRRAEELARQYKAQQAFQ